MAGVQLPSNRLGKRNFLRCGEAVFVAKVAIGFHGKDAAIGVAQPS